MAIHTPSTQTADPPSKPVRGSLPTQPSALRHHSLAGKDLFLFSWVQVGSYQHWHPQEMHSNTTRCCHKANLPCPCQPCGRGIVCTCFSSISLFNTPEFLFPTSRISDLEVGFISSVAWGGEEMLDLADHRRGPDWWSHSFLEKPSILSDALWVTNGRQRHVLSPLEMTTAAPLQAFKTVNQWLWVWLSFQP